MVESAIETRKLNFSVRNKAILNDIEIAIEKGTFYAIVGPNGSGKTTFLKTISKVLNVDENTIFVESRDIAELQEKKLARRMACVPQNTNLENEFTALDIVLMGRAPYKKFFEAETRADIRLAKEAMTMTNTWHLKDVAVNCLSGGEKQRVVIARAIAQQTEIILLDEPVSNLDIHHQIEILSLITKLNAEKGVTIIAVLHDLNHVLQYSQKVLLLSSGQLVAHGNTAEVLTEDRIRDLFGVNAYFVPNPRTGKNVLVAAIDPL